MLARAAIVLLVVLNLGVAAWWASGGRVPAEAAAAADEGVPRLRLLSEVPPAQRPPAAPLVTATPPTADTAAVDAASNAPATVAPDPSATDPAAAAAAVAAGSAALPADARCLAIGPFADAASAETARVRLQAAALRLRERTQVPASSRGWRVWLPPLADTAAAQAMAARLRDAGFSDQFVLGAGEDANGIALGRFGSEASARQREAAVRAAGFTDVRAASIDTRPPSVPQRWVDVAIAAGGPATGTLRSLAAAARADRVDCATLR